MAKYAIYMGRRMRDMFCFLRTTSTMTVSYLSLYSKDELWTYPISSEIKHFFAISKKDKSDESNKETDTYNQFVLVIKEAGFQ